MKTAREMLMELEALGEEIDAQFEEFEFDYDDTVLSAEASTPWHEMNLDEVGDSMPALLFRTLH